MEDESTESTYCGSIPVSELAEHAKECEVCQADFIDRGLIESNACAYCGGTCPDQPDDGKNICDGFAGDIDNLYEE